MGPVLDATAEAELRRFDERQTKERAEHVVRLQRQSDRRQEARDLLAGTRWRPAGGGWLEVSEMSPNHAANTLALLERSATEYAARLHVIPPHGMDTKAWIRAQPLCMALAARAAETPTLAERRRDRQSRKRWEKERPKRARRERALRAWWNNLWAEEHTW